MLLGIDGLDLFFHAASLRVTHVLVVLLVIRIQFPWTLITGAIHLLAHYLSKCSTSASTTISKHSLWLLFLAFLSSLLH